MRRNGLVAIAATAIALASAVPAHAQSWRADIGLNGGGSWYSSMLSNDQFGGNGDPVHFKPNWLTGAQLTLWAMPRIGVRANFTYTDAKMRQGSNILFDDVNLWSGTGDLLFRFHRPAPEFTHMEMLPYLALGAGAKWHNPAQDNFSVYDPTTQETWTGAPFTCTSGTCAGLRTGGSSFFLSEERVFMGLAGLGTDVRLAPNFGLRLEVGDRIWKPALIAVTSASTHAGAIVQATASDTKVSKWVNEIYAQIGLHMLLGVAAPPVVAVTPRPAPPPAPTPEPPPPLAPTTTTARVCVVDPTLGPGLRTETATITIATGDTTVMVNGTATPLRSAFTGVPVASGAQWYVQGQPLTIGSGRNSLGYVSFGSARNIDSGDLTFVGTVNGLPVYANKSDVTSLTIPSPAVDIGGNTAVVTGLRNVQVLYVPVSAYGCNFQPIQLQQAVRKVRG